MKTLIVSIIILSLWRIGACVDEDPNRVRAKRALTGLERGLPNNAFDGHSLLLIPAAVEPGFETRSKREVPKDQEQHKKYHRLAHSVHVQSDIRFR